MSLAGREERGDRTWTVVRFASPGGDTYDLLVDPETGESTFGRSVADGRTRLTKRSDLRTVNGVRFAFLEETEGETARQAQPVTWEKVTVNAGLDDARFARPSPSGARAASGARRR